MGESGKPALGGKGDLGEREQNREEPGSTGRCAPTREKKKEFLLEADPAPTSGEASQHLLPRALGFRALASGFCCRAASRGMGAASLSSPGSECPGEWAAGAVTSSSATARTKVLVSSLSHIPPSWSGVDHIDWGLGNERGGPQT